MEVFWACPSRSGPEDRSRETVSLGWPGIPPEELLAVQPAFATQWLWCLWSWNRSTEWWWSIWKTWLPPLLDPLPFASEPKLHPASSGSYPICSTLLSPANSLRITSTLVDWRSCWGWDSSPPEPRPSALALPRGVSCPHCSSHSTPTTASPSTLTCNFAGDPAVNDAIKDGDEPVCRQELEQPVLWWSHKNLKLKTVTALIKAAPHYKHQPCSHTKENH